MPTFVKLTEAASSTTILVERVSLDTSGNYPDYHLHTDEGNTVVVLPKAAGDRQLERLKIATPEALTGAYVTVSRSAEVGKNGKLFWNVAIASPPKPESKRLPPPPVASAKVNAPKPPAWDDVPLPDDPEDATPATTRPAVAPVAFDKADAIRDRYLALWEQVATVQVAVGKRLGIPISGESVQAATATIWIGWRDAGAR